ncbi:glycosyltransferase family 2 protein [Salegentibacter flavus]|uniref:Glycosyl transferase family 2 n=1 Tax=Salegentibacter flavus TaxID=287099 RepID=A0A1I5A6H2_9FLAO|nr:glycosyltransferase [Salegentibacter flavus]SFN58053.1 Glycosyl transferase family 2 [Salegentibacter flavus]
MKKDPKHPLVSIIVITYNSSKFVLETLESAKDQTYENVELIISDDSSNDNTVEICENWIKENKTRFVRAQLVTAKVNQGIPANCNRGIKNAEGEWIRIVAGDDALLPHSTQKYIDYINEQEDPDIQVLHSNVEWFNGSLSMENKKPLRPLSHFKLNDPTATAEDQFQILLRSNKVLAGTLIIKRAVFNKIGLYDEEPKLWEDRPILLKMTQNGIKLHYLDFCSLKYRKHISSIQKQKNSEKFLPDYIVLKSTYYYKHYLKFLPFFERFTKAVLLQRIIWFDKLYLNKNKFLNKIFFRILGFPWAHISNRYKKKYF